MPRTAAKSILFRTAKALGLDVPPTPADGELELGRLNHWQVGGFFAFENGNGVNAGLAIHIRRPFPNFDMPLAWEKCAGGSRSR